MRMSVKLVALCSAVVMLGAACTGGGGSSNSNSPSSTSGGHLILGTTSNIDTLNPFVTFQQNSYAAFEYIYPQLVQYDSQTFAFKPDFAQSWDTSADGLTWTFHTTPNAKWSDGQPLTANDAAWTMNTILKYGDGPAGNLIGSLGFVKSVQATDDNTLVVTYAAAVANALPELQNISILPQHVWAQYATGDGKGLRTFPNVPDGWPAPGEWRSVRDRRVQEGRESRSSRRTPTSTGPKPSIDGFGLQYFSNDDAMVAALQSGQIQAAINVPPTAMATLKKNVGHHRVQRAGLAAARLHHQLESAQDDEPRAAATERAHGHGVRDRPQRDRADGLARVREAGILDRASGRRRLERLHRSNRCRSTSTRRTPSSMRPGTREGPDGIRVANGHPMSYTVLFAADESGAGDAAFRIIQNGFQQIGIDITQRKMDNDAVNTAIFGDNNTYNTFDLAMWDWYPCCPVPDFILSVLQCSQFGGWSDTGYCNKAYDKMYDAQQVAPDQSKRVKIVYAMQQMIDKDRPYIVLSYDDQLNAWSNDWTGFVESSLGLFNNLSKESFTQVHHA